jgi:integrase
VLTDIACRNTKKNGALQKLSDGGGLQLWIQPTGSRQWRLAYRYAGKQKLLALGPYPAITLAEAREKREEAKRHLAHGRDPSAVKKAEKLAQLESNFEAVAKEYLGKLRREGRAATTMSKIEWLLGFAYPEIGTRHVAEIRPVEVLAVLRKVEKRGRYESARRLRATMGAVFRYAVATGRAEIDPTTALQGALITPKSTPRPALTDPAAVGALLRAIDSFDGQSTTRLALQLMALLFPRPGELRATEWSELDLENAVWSIPAQRTKMRREHRVPLAPQALAALEELRRLRVNGPFVFPSVRTWKRPMSEGTMNAALRRLGYAKDEVTAHGFRATASTLLNESGLWSPDAIERQLAHVETNEIRRVYARGEHWEERVRMMAWWAEHLEFLRAK